MQHEHTTPDINISANFLLFADVKGFSKLDEYQCKTFFSDVIPLMAAVINGENKPKYCNTWGDAVFAVFDDAEKAAGCALELCERFAAKTKRWKKHHGLPDDLAIRVSLHFGACYESDNKITGRKEYLGSNVNLAARIEPIVVGNQVWATERFVNALEKDYKESLFLFPLGKRELVKGWGAETLHRLSRHPIDEKTALAGTHSSDLMHPVLSIHHISLPVSNLKRSVKFYQDVLKLRQADAPEIMDATKRRLAFKFPGVWFHLPNGQQLHLIPHVKTDAPVTFRNTKEIHLKDVHFALAVRDYEAMCAMLDASDSLIVKEDGPMRFQCYILDPDSHVIEITSSTGPKPNA